MTTKMGRMIPFYQITHYYGEKTEKWVITATRAEIKHILFLDPSD